jgi:hypothetical protein
MDVFELGMELVKKIERKKLKEVLNMRKWLMIIKIKIPIWPHPQAP